jgi:hypothetical protein
MCTEEQCSLVRELTRGPNPGPRRSRRIAAQRKGVKMDFDVQDEEPKSITELIKQLMAEENYTTYISPELGSSLTRDIKEKGVCSTEEDIRIFMTEYLESACIVGFMMMRQNSSTNHIQICDLYICNYVFRNTKIWLVLDESEKTIVISE